MVPEPTGWSDAAAVAAVAAAVDAGSLAAAIEAALATSDVDARLHALKDASERQRGISPPAALRLADAVIAGSERTGRPALLALGLMAKGDALRLVDDHAAAEAHLDRAAAIFRELGDAVGWARTRIGWVAARRHTAHTDAEVRGAVAACAEGYAVLTAAGEWRRAATLDLNVGAVLTDIGAFGEATGHYHRALEVAARLPPGDAARHLSAQILANQAVNLASQGALKASLDQHQAARAIFASLGHSAAVIVQDLNAADVYMGMGDLARALALLIDVEAAAAGVGDLSSAAVAALDAARCYLQLSCPAEALHEADRARAWFEARAMPLEAASAGLYGGMAHAALGHRQAAAARLAAAAAAFEALGNAPFLGLAALHAAGAHLAAGDADAAIREAERAQGLLGAAGRRVHAARAGIVLGHALLDGGRAAPAIPLAAAALATADACGVPQLAAEGHHLRARVARATRRPRTALVACEAAVRTIEALQSRLPFGLRTHFLGRHLGPYHEAIDLCLDAGDPERALAYLERAKSRALVDFVADAAFGDVADGSRTGTPRDANGVDGPSAVTRGAGGPVAGGDDPADIGAARVELAALAREHQWYANQLHGGDGATDADPARSPDLRARMAELERRIEAIHRRLDLARAGGELPVARRPDVAAIRHQLGAGTALVAYYLRPGDGTAFVVTPDGVEPVPLGAGAAAVDAAVKTLRDLWAMTARLVSAGRAGAAAALDASARESLRALHRDLVEPVAARLAGADRVVVVPHGAAHAVPFHALSDGRRHWMEAVELVACPSAELWRLAMARPAPGGTGALVMACSDGGRLPHAVEEARAVADLLPGVCVVDDAATAAMLRHEGARRAVVHVAAHGEARFDNPQFAHLQLGDGRFTTSDAFNLRLDGALVTLSACESGCSVVAGGDELIGLSRGFLYAGAATVIQSLWRVEDAATARLMVGMCRGLREGRRASDALRQAQLDLAGDGTPVFFWGAFQALGTGQAVRLAPPDGWPSG